MNVQTMSLHGKVTVNVSQMLAIATNLLKIRSSFGDQCRRGPNINKWC